MTITPTDSNSRLKAIPITPFAKRTSSWERTSASPETRAMPSPASRTVPMSLTSTVGVKSFDLAAEFSRQVLERVRHRASRTGIGL